MEMNMDALKALELKLAEYSKENGAIAEHESGNKNGCNAADCAGSCWTSCSGMCSKESPCGGSCYHTSY